MFFFIGGVQPKTIFLDKQARSCASCGHLKVYLKRVDQYISLFFIPLFPVKRGIPFLACDNCGALYDEKGARMDVKFTGVGQKCSHCGRYIAPDFSFCPYCGRSVG